MARQIIRQPDGKYALYSSIVDAFILQNVERCEIVDFLVKEEEEKLMGQVARICDQLDAGKKPYYQFTIPYEEAAKKHAKYMRHALKADKP